MKAPRTPRKGRNRQGSHETLEICRSKRVLKEVKKAERAADRRKTRSFEEVFGKPLR